MGISFVVTTLSDPTNWIGIGLAMGLSLAGSFIKALVRRKGISVTFAFYRIKSTKKPKRSRSFALDLFLPIHIARDAQASLEDVYPIWVSAYGPRRSRWIRRVQILRMIFGHHLIPAIEFAERVLKIVRGGRAAD